MENNIYVSAIFKHLSNIRHVLPQGIPVRLMTIHPLTAEFSANPDLKLTRYTLRIVFALDVNCLHFFCMIFELIIKCIFCTIKNVQKYKNYQYKKRRTSDEKNIYDKLTAVYFSFRVQALPHLFDTDLYRRSKAKN